MKYTIVDGDRMTRNGRKMTISKSCIFFNRTDFIKITGKSLATVLKTVILIVRLPVFQGSNTLKKYFIINSTGKSSIPL